MKTQKAASIKEAVSLLVSPAPLSGSLGGVTDAANCTWSVTLFLGTW